ncbi:hypothetical protein GUITHDRAFT_122588 [Guillardia theta CCMP2712]|uniref:AP2/ERF domain-containing protein n=2 Tax=Guillardia theta TaxID=55529 RepID=L1I537_GUITC|nr:hypothetical protein GUITHDRAFT_122588 [Guillardia theta CCMP2712]EKX31207.1 hypothetical protein GUITHDRAFT_122588 [Guillardia theta CCMP2712]|eukprot:XP_005818187.1 hypothetical protein GUITHDRAFT_122588 [Guillardia theta CCMP2712]
MLQALAGGRAFVRMAEREPIPHDKMQGLAWEQMQRERAFSIWQEWEESDIESALMVMQSLMTAGIEAFEQDDIMKVLNECGWDKNEAFTKLKSMHAERQGRGKKQKVEVLDPLPSSSSRQPVEHVSTKEVQAKDSEDGHRSGTSGGKDRKRKEHEEEFKIGQLIEAKYRGGKKMYPGIISAIWPGGKYNITYDDGDREFGVDKKMIRLCRDYDWCKKQELNVLEVGERVYGRWNHSKGEKLWYLGKVVQVESTEGGGRYTIQYDDGDREPNVKRMNLQTAEERKNASVHCAPAMSTGVVQEASAELDDGVMCELEGLFSRSVRKKRTIFNAANEDEEGDDGTKKRKRKRVKEQSDFIGVKRLLEGVKRGRKWEAFIEVEQEKHRLGAYKEEREAARAYDMAAMRFFGTSAMLNFASSRKGYEPTPELEDVLEEIRGLYKVKVKEEEEEGGEANMDARVANERTKIQDDSKKISEATTKVTGRKEEEQNLKDREEKKNLIIDDDDDLCLSEEIPLAKLYSKKSLREVEEKAEAKEPRSESKSDDVSGKMAGKKSAKNQDEDKEGKSDEAMNPQKLQKNELKEMREMKEKKERKDEKDDDEKKEAKEESEKRIVTVKAMKDMKDKDVSSKHVTKLKDLSKVNGVQIKKLPREEKKENAFKRDETKSNHSNKPHEKEAKQKRKLRLQVESDDDDQVMSVNTKKTVKIDKKNPFKEKTAVQQGGTNVEQVMNDRATTAVKDVQETMLSATVLQGKKSKKNNSEGQLSETSKTHLGNQGGKGSARREGEEKIAQDKTTKGSTQPETEMNPEGSLQSKTNVNPDRTKPKEREIKLSTKSALKGKISSSKTFEQNDVTIAFEKTHEISTTLLETDPTSSENKSVQQREVDTSMSNPAQVSVSTSSQAPQSNKQDDCSIPTDVKIPSQPDGSLPSREVFLSLLDPISNELMTHPCKGAECSHQSCFDKPSFLKSKKVNIPNEKKWESNIKTVIR